MQGYWNTIFPGSNRYIAESGLVGDNRDVRPPEEEEKWSGGMITGGGSGRSNSADVIKRVTLVLDGVFFQDGHFLGPDTAKMFEQTVADAEAHILVARIANRCHHNGLTASEILAEVEKETGAAPDAPPVPLHLRTRSATKDDFLRAALENIAYEIASRRRFARSASDEEQVINLMSWDKVALPRFRSN